MIARIENVKECEWFDAESFDADNLVSCLETINLSFTEIAEHYERSGWYNQNAGLWSHTAGIKGAGVPLFDNDPEISSGKRFDRSGDTMLLGEPDTEVPQKTFIDLIKEKLGLLVFEQDGVYIRKEKIPLFRFNSPRVEGSEVRFESHNGGTLDSSYQLTFFGTGFGKTKKIDFSMSNSFVCPCGAFKQVFLPAEVEVRLMSAYDRNGVFKKHFLQTELLRPSVENPFNIGIENLTEDEFLTGIAPVTESRNYLLAGDKPGSVHSFEERYSKVENYGFRTGFTIFDMEAISSARISRNNEVILKYKLPSGSDYRVKKIMDGMGLWWE